MAMIDYISYQPRTRSQVVTRLQKRGDEDYIIEAVLERADEYGLINDEEFARSWVDSRKRANGKTRIRFDLMRRGIANDLIEEALLNYSGEEEDDGAIREAEKALRGIPMTVPEQKRKQRAAARVMRRGFPPGVAWSAVNTCWIEPDTDDDDA